MIKLTSRPNDRGLDLLLEYRDKNGEWKFLASKDFWMGDNESRSRNWIIEMFNEYQNSLGKLDLDQTYQPNTLTLNLPELKALSRILEHDYVNYEDLEAKKVVDKIFDFIKEINNE